MNWQVIKKSETGSCEISYLDLDGGEFKWIVEINCRKNNYKVRCFKNETLDSLAQKKVFRTLKKAQSYGEKWIEKQAISAAKSITELFSDNIFAQKRFVGKLKKALDKSVQ